MNAEQVARSLGISTRTVYRHIKKGTIIATKKKEQELSIAADQIEKLRRVLALDNEPTHDRTLYPDMSGQIGYDIEQRIASLAQSIANLNATVASQTRRIDELAIRVAELEAKQSPGPLTETPHTSQPQKRATIAKSAPSDGDMSIGVFARQHNISDRSFRRYIDHGLNGEKIEAETSRLGRFL